MLAAELALAGIDVAIVERRADQAVAGSRAGGLHARGIEILDQRGIADRFLAAGKVMQINGFGFIPLDISDLPTRHNYGLALPQEGIERLLAAWVDELKIRIYREREVTGFEQHAFGVDVRISDGSSWRAQYLVGCDGGRSVVRKAAGIDFTGWDASISYLIAEGTPGTEPAWGGRRDERGVHGIAKLDDGKRMRVVSVEPQVKHGDDPTLAELRDAMVTAFGSDYGIHDVTWLSRFSDAARQAATYRHGRVLVAGDAAHVHSPTGGQGLNLGVQDAVNLGWKLAQVIHGMSPESLLDTYHAEQHPVGARILENTLAQTALSRGDARTMALHKRVSELLAIPEARRHYGAMMACLDIHYDLGGGHPLVGRRMPDLEVVTADGPRRMFSFLHDAKPVLLDLGGATTITPRVRVVRATYDGKWELPVIGEVPAPCAVLIRPDGYVAWVNDSGHSLADALAKWF
jgi:2-polyprenyl-6-methoxyphenol hydroxylase-like FAD-dependent oxidoreductase